MEIYSKTVTLVFSIFQRKAVKEIITFVRAIPEKLNHGKLGLVLDSFSYSDTLQIINSNPNIIWTKINLKWTTLTS
jgi:hypothetical protein